MPRIPSRSPSPTTRARPTTNRVNGTHANGNTSTTTLESVPSAIHHYTDHFEERTPRPSTDTRDTRHTQDTTTSHITTSTTLSWRTLESRFNAVLRLGGTADVVVHSNPQVVNERRNVDSNGRVRANGHGTATEHRLAAQQVAQLGLDLPPPGGRELAGGASRGRDLDGLYTARTMSGEGRARVAIPTGLAARAANGDPVEDETVGATEYEISDEQRAAMEVALNGNGNGSGEASGSGSGSADDSASTHSTGSQETERGGPVEAVDGPAVGPTLGEAGSEDFKVELKRLFEIENIVKEFASSEEWITAVEGLVSDELKALEWDGRSGSVNGESDSGSSGEVIQEDRVSVESVRLVETTE